MTAPKLNTVIATNIPMKLRIKKRGGSYPEKVYKNGHVTDELTGHNQYLYIFEDEQGRELSHYASEPQEETLKLFQAGEWIQVVRKEELNTKTNKRFTMYIFTPLEGAEARSAATPQIVNNTTQTRTAGKQNDLDEKKRLEVTSMILHGFMTAAISNGKTVKEAHEIAEQAYYSHKLLTEQIFSSAV